MKAKVFFNNVEKEEIDITISGTLMTVDGPYWFGEGLLCNSEYVGRAYYKANYGTTASQLKPVFHHMILNDDVYSGKAFFESGTTDLEWRLI